METNNCCGCGVLVSTIVELCLSVIANIGLLLGFIHVAQPFFESYESDWWQIGLFSLVLITTNTILLIFELKGIRGKSIKKWNLVMRIFWTVVVVFTMVLFWILYLIQLISCTNDACLIWDRNNFTVQILQEPYEHDDLSLSHFFSPKY